MREPAGITVPSFRVRDSTASRWGPTDGVLVKIDDVCQGQCTYAELAGLPSDSR